MTADSLDAVAETADRLSALLAAGLPPSAAWQHLADGQASPLLTAAARAAGAGEPVAPALVAGSSAAPEEARAAWRALAAGVAVADRTGAPLADVLEQLAVTLRDLQGAERDVRAALTGPRMSGRLVLALPAVGVAFGLGLGFDPLGVLLGTPLGLACAAAGAVLYLAGWGWTRRLVRRARPSSDLPGLEAELVAVALAAGLPVSAARALVRDLAAACGVALRDGPDIDRSAALATSAGVPVASLLRSEARHRRRRAASDARIRAEALAVTLLLPLGVCLLPSFMLLSVAPLLLSIVSSTALPL
ncbi:type II secretion system F family protein [Naasia sp. SYSU D00948]|uniref:type II secretion system F family protein n=1 Tax=Naasia sp. SYSU D00948 TaxID=2817379 RepID=UPI001B307126|nr:type II secretion system F family protein [Naasia sp. SYSU D00948]